MLNFRKITLADRPWIQEALKQSDFMGCEYSFANNLAWCRAADSQICQYENFYLTCSFDTEDGAPHFSYPCGCGRRFLQWLTLRQNGKSRWSSSG